MTKISRIRFTVAGKHPLLYLCRNYLIHTGLFMLVPWSDSPDICIYGGALCKGDNLEDSLTRLSLEYAEAKNVPVVVLSTSSMYSDRTKLYSPIAAEPYPMSEEEPSLLIRHNVKGLFSLVVEDMFLGVGSNLVLRPFNIYGPQIGSGVISKFIDLATKDEPLSVRGHGYQTRCFMHEDDFLYYFHRLIERFYAKDIAGVKNVGTEESVSINRLADSIWKLAKGAESETKLTRELRSPKDSDNLWKQPRLDKEIVQRITLRKGLWRLLQR